MTNQAQCQMMCCNCKRPKIPSPVSNGYLQSSETTDGDDYEDQRQNVPRRRNSMSNEPSFKDHYCGSHRTVRTTETEGATTDGTCSHYSNITRHGRTPNFCNRVASTIDYDPQSTFLKKMKHQNECLEQEGQIVTSGVETDIENVHCNHESHPTYQIVQQNPRTMNLSEEDCSCCRCNPHRRKCGAQNRASISQERAVDDAPVHYTYSQNPNECLNEDWDEEPENIRRSEHVSRSKRPSRSRGRKKKKSGSVEKCKSQTSFQPSLKQPLEDSCERCWRYASPARSPVNKPEQKYDPNFRRSHTDLEKGDGDVQSSESEPQCEERDLSQGQTFNCCHTNECESSPPVNPMHMSPGFCPVHCPRQNQSLFTSAMNTPCPEVNKNKCGRNLFTQSPTRAWEISSVKFAPQSTNGLAQPPIRTPDCSGVRFATSSLLRPVQGRTLTPGPQRTKPSTSEQNSKERSMRFSSANVNERRKNSPSSRSPNKNTMREGCVQMDSHTRGPIIPVSGFPRPKSASPSAFSAVNVSKRSPNEKFDAANYKPHSSLVREPFFPSCTVYSSCQPCENSDATTYMEFAPKPRRSAAEPCNLSPSRRSSLRSKENNSQSNECSSFNRERMRPLQVIPEVKVTDCDAEGLQRKQTPKKSPKGKKSKSPTPQRSSKSEKSSRNICSDSSPKSASRNSSKISSKTKSSKSGGSPRRSPQKVTSPKPKSAMEDCLRSERRPQTASPSFQSRTCSALEDRPHSASLPTRDVYNYDFHLFPDSLSALRDDPCVPVPKKVPKNSGGATNCCTCKNCIYNKTNNPLPCREQSRKGSNREFQMYNTQTDNSEYPSDGCQESRQAVKPRRSSNSPPGCGPRKYVVFYMSEYKKNKGDDVEVLMEELTQYRPDEEGSKQIEKKMKKILEYPTDSMALRFQKGVSESLKNTQSSRILYF